MKRIKKYISDTTIGNIIIVCIAILFYLTISNFSDIKNTVTSFYKLLSPFVAAFVIAFLLNLPMRTLETRIFSKFKAKRILSILTIYLIAGMLIAALLFAIIPQITESVINIANNIPRHIQSIITYLEEYEAQHNINPSVSSQISNSLGITLNETSSAALSLASKFVDWSVSLGGFAVNSTVAVVSSIYMLATKERLVFQIKKILFAFLSRDRADKIIAVTKLAATTFSDFINGRIIESIILCVICFAGMLLIYPPYALLIAVIIGFTNMIPYFGPFLGAIPAAIALLMINPADAIVFIIFVIILQQFDNNILGPKILGDAVGLAPIWVLASIVIGGKLMGFIGMIIGVPAFAVLINLFSQKLTKRLSDKNIIIDESGMDLSIPSPE